MSKQAKPEARIRAFCLAFPEAEEVEQFGHPFFKWRKKPFAVLGDGGLSVKVQKSLQTVFLEDPRFTKTPYIGNHGWISLRLTDSLDWEEVEGLIEGSYQFVSSKKQEAKTRRI